MLVAEVIQDVYYAALMYLRRIPGNEQVDCHKVKEKCPAEWGRGNARGRCGLRPR
jgi:hypothetical protein